MKVAQNVSRDSLKKTIETDLLGVMREEFTVDLHEIKKSLFNSRLTKNEVRRRRNHNLYSADLNFYGETICVRNFVRQAFFSAFYSLEI